MLIVALLVIILFLGSLGASFLELIFFAGIDVYLAFFSMDEAKNLIGLIGLVLVAINVSYKAFALLKEYSPTSAQIVIAIRNFATIVAVIWALYGCYFSHKFNPAH